ncbi:TraX family protein [Ruminococcus sp. 5_1_39BFAA]|uniref:TraX family protein n=1 Tax=Ruminococcus sp. 5_1_39BFAA TaxID=457412 RepID=UPI003565A257
MEKTTPNSFLPEKYRILSGSALKVLAMVIMLIDHTAAFLLNRYAPATTTLFTLGNTGFSIYRIMRDVGRAAFPIFCFLLVEGFLHTHDRRKYGLNLLVFACISEIPWNFAHGGELFNPARQNVFFTLFLGYLAFCALDYYKDRETMQLLCMLALFAVSWYLHADYGWRGYVFLLIMYWLHNKKAAQAVIGSSWLYYEWKACFAFLAINMYNGKRGFIRGKGAKYFFYAFYPVHIAILYILQTILFPL